MFARKYTLERHVHMAHGSDMVYECGLCPAFFPTRQAVEAHRQKRHRNRSKFVLRQSAHGRSCETYRLYLPHRFTTNFSACIDYCIDKTDLLIRYLLVEKRHMKVGLNLSLRFAKPQFNNGGGAEEDALGAEESEVITYNIRPASRVYMFGDADGNERRMSNSFAEVGERFGDFNHRGSGWILVDCLYLDVDVGQCLSMQGSCSIHQINSERDKVWVLREKADGSCQGDFGHRCFYHAVAAFLLTNQKTEMNQPDPQSHTEVELEQFVLNNIKEAVPAPVPLKRVKDFEQANAHLDIAVNVIYCSDESMIYPAYASPNIKARNQVVLLLFHKDMAMDKTLTDEEKNIIHQNTIQDYGDEGSAYLATPEGMQAIMHYAPVFDASQLFAKRVSNEEYGDGASTISHTRPRYHCFNCFMAVQSESALQAHVAYCHAENGQVYKVPKEGTYVSFEPKQKSFKLGYIFFFDFETLQVSCN